MSKDVLADVLAMTRLGSSVIGQVELVPPWGVEVDPMSEASIHLVQRGACFLKVEGQRAPIRLADGDLVLIRSGIRHALSDRPHGKLQPYRSALSAMPKRLASFPSSRRHETTTVLCAKYLFQHRGPHPLITLLPPLIHLRAVEASQHGSLQLLLALLRAEASQPGSGSELVVPRLVDTLLVFVVRAWLETQPLGAGGWFGALRDPAIAKALSRIHEAPDAPWTLERLASEAGQSRATFARRFTELVGEPPVAYLTRWRMLLAAKLLTETLLSLDEIATLSGYESASALSKAFRRHQGCAPGRYRNQARSA